jgi:hypothetical protein
MGQGFGFCSLGTIDASGLDCMDLDPVSNVYVVSEQRAVAIMNGERLLIYDGDRWRADTTAIPFAVSEVWADETNVLAVGRVGAVLWREGDGWRLEDPGTLAHLTALWGTSREDVWAGTSDGHVLHYDGVAWTDVASLGGVSCETVGPVVGIWGADGQVFVHTPTQLARFTDGELETLANWTCSPTGSSMAIMGVWGTSTSEVFIGIIDQARSAGSPCGAAHVVYYDGESFHRM